MTTASSRAVSLASVSRLRTALLAAVSVSLMGTIVPSANAASCATTTGNDLCLIDLTSFTDNHNGQAGTDTLNFTNLFTTYSASAFATSGTPQFQNFETANLINSYILIDDTNSADTAQDLNWTIDGTSILDLNFLSTATTNDSIGNGSSITIDAGGFLNVGGSERIGALTSNGTTTVFAGATLTAASLSGSGLAQLVASSTLSVGAANNTFSGQILGGGNLVLSGSSGNKWILNSNNGYTGTTTVNGGTLEIQHASAIDNSSSVTINGGEITSKTVANYDLNSLTINGGRLTGNATIHGNVSSNGGLQPGSTSIPPGSSIENPGQDMGRITIIGDYTATGAGAYVGSFINIDAAAPAGGTPGVTHDFLDIQGNVTGTQPTLFSHLSFLNNPTGFATTGNGIQVINITGTNSGHDFYQQLAMTAGPYQYILKYVPDYNAFNHDGYFLQSAARDELVARAALISAGQALVRDCYHDNQRVPDSPKGATYGRGWIGYGRGSSSFGSDTGVDSDVNFSCTTGGLDWRMGGGWFGGVSGGFGDTDGNITTAAGVGKFTGTGRSAEVFASFTSRSLFINLSAGYNSMSYIYDGALMASRTAKTSGLVATAQTGVALDLDAIAVKLLGQVSYDGTNCSDTCLGVTATQETGLVEAKGSVRFDGVANNGSIRPWVAVSISDVLSNGINSATMGAVTVSQDANSQLVSLDGGMQAYLDQNFALTLEGGYHESLTVDVTGYKAAVGLKMYW